MNKHDIATKVDSAMYHQCQERGYATPVDVLMDLGYLSKENYEAWRRGRVPYLERVCTANLSKLSAVAHEIRVYAQKHGLKPSFCFYNQWKSKKNGGRAPKSATALRFSKSGSPGIERGYATHYVDEKRTAKLKAEAAENAAAARATKEASPHSDDGAPRVAGKAQPTAR